MGVRQASCRSGGIGRRDPARMAPKRPEHNESSRCEVTPFNCGRPTRAILADAQVRAREDQGSRDLFWKRRQRGKPHTAVAVLQEQFEQSRLGLGQSKLDTEAERSAQAGRTIWQRPQSNWTLAGGFSYPIAAFRLRTPTRASQHPAAVSEKAQGAWGQASTTAVSRPR